MESKETYNKALKLTANPLRLRLAVVGSLALTLGGKMLKNFGIIREVARIIEKAAYRVVEALKAEWIEQEHHFTDRMLGRIEQAIDGYTTKGIVWRAKTFTDRGRNAQETRYGADFLGIVSIRLPNFSLDKGFLAQAKLLNPPGRMSSSEYQRLQQQCRNMLNITPDSFVFFYSPTGIRIIPASSVISCNTNINLYDYLYSRTISKFYEDHFACFIGDIRLRAPNIEETLENIAENYRVRNVLVLYVIHRDLL